MKRSNGGIDLSLDYHAHVLPGCDHGSDRLETSLRQLDMAAAAGIRTVCATPHFYPHKESAESFLRRREECAQLLRAHLPEQAPQICLGAEVLICDGMERLEGLHRLCREGTNELLRTHRAEPLCKAADVLEILGIGAQTAAPEQQRFDPAAVSPDAQQVYAALKPTPQSMDALCAATRLPAGRVLAACTELELMGGAQAQPGRRYIAL